jgi:chromosome partitioning protein
LRARWRGLLIVRPPGSSGDTAVRTIAVVNRKGGSGKTTTAVSLAAVLAERGLPTLLIDLDPQGSASAWLADARDDHDRTRAIADAGDLGSFAVRTTVPCLEVVPSSAGLLAAEQTRKGEISLGVVRAVERLRPDWAFVIIDCPPSLSYLSIGALMAVREVIIPVEAHAIALRGVAAVVREMGRIQSTLNPGLRNPLIVACRVNRTLHARGVIDELDRSYGWRLARATIRESIRLPEAEAARLPITAYAPDSGACLDYRLLADELMERGELQEPIQRRVSRWRRLFTRSTHVAAAVPTAGATR